MSELYWSQQWAELVGADGHLVTDLLGRTAPGWDDADADRIAVAWRDGDRRSLEKTDQPAFEVAGLNGLTHAVACARQSATRVVAVHAPHDPDRSGGDRWHRWLPARDVLGYTVAALVLRRVADPDLIAQMTVPWVEAFGPLPDQIETTTEQPHNPCYVCGQPRGVRVVTEAEAARLARMLQRYEEASVQDLKADAEKAQRMLAEYHRDHPSWDEVDGKLTAVLDSAPKLPAATRRHIESAMGVPAAPERPAPASDPRGGDEPIALFGPGAAS